MTRCILLTCGLGSGGEVVHVPVDEGQVVDDVSTQSSLLQQSAAAVADGVLAVTPESKDAVVLNEVLTQVKLGAGVLEGAAAVRTGASVIVCAHLRRQVRQSEDRRQEQIT